MVEMTRRWKTSSTLKLSAIDMSLERVEEVMNPLDEDSIHLKKEGSQRRLTDHGFLIDEEISDAKSDLVEDVDSGYSF